MISAWNPLCWPDRSSSAPLRSPSSSPSWLAIFVARDGARLGGCSASPRSAAARPSGPAPPGGGRGRRHRRPGRLLRGRVAARVRCWRASGSSESCVGVAASWAACWAIAYAISRRSASQAADAASPTYPAAPAPPAKGGADDPRPAVPRRRHPLPLLLRRAAGRAERLRLLRPAPDRRARRPALAGLGAGRRAARDPPPDHRADPPRAGHGAGRSHAAARSRPPSRPAPPAPAPAKPRPEWSRRRVQNLLLALGVGLLAVAAIIFLAVSWDRLGVGGRSAVMAGVTALAGFAATRTHRRGLGSTAEWLSLLTVGLAILDCAGARAADLAGLGSTPVAVYWAGALATVAVLAGLFAVVLPTRSLRVAAAVLGQLPVPLLSVHVATDIDRPLALTATGLTAQTVAALALATAWPFGSRARDARIVVAVGGAVSLVVASMYAGGAAYAEAGSLVVGTALLLVLAAVLAVAGTVLADRPAYAVAVPVLDGGAAVLLVAAAWAPAYDVVPDRWLPAVLAATGAALLAATLLVPAARRSVPAVVALGAALLPALAAVEPVARTPRGTCSARCTGRGRSRRPRSPSSATDRRCVELLAAGVALIVAARALRLRHLAAVAVPVLTGAAVLTPPAFGAGYPLTPRRRRGDRRGPARRRCPARHPRPGRPRLDRPRLGRSAARPGHRLVLRRGRRDPADPAGGGSRAPRGRCGRPWGRGAASLAGRPGHQRAAARGRRGGRAGPLRGCRLGGRLVARARPAGHGRRGRRDRHRAPDHGRGPVLGAAALGRRRGGRRRRRWPTPPPSRLVRRRAGRLRTGGRLCRGPAARPHCGPGRPPPAGPWRGAGRGRGCRRTRPGVRRAGRRAALDRPARRRGRRRRWSPRRRSGTASAGWPA